MADNFTLRPLSTFCELEPEWLVPGYIPAGQVTLLAGEGGVGKTFVWCDIVAAVSTGRPCCLYPQQPLQLGQSMILSGEDDIERVLLRRLREAGADAQRVAAYAPGDNGGKLLDIMSIPAIITQFHPNLLVLDPLQAFLPRAINMAARNDIRSVIAPVMEAAAATGAAVIIVVHTNKRDKAYGRTRIADSADLWDAARSVLLLGNTSALDGAPIYVSHEKCNYGPLQPTVLVALKAGHMNYLGTSPHRDAYYQAQGLPRLSKQAECEEQILALLVQHDGIIPTAELDRLLSREYGGVLQRAKRNLSLRERKIVHIQRDRVHYTQLAGPTPTHKLSK